MQGLCWPYSHCSIPVFVPNAHTACMMTSVVVWIDFFISHRLRLSLKYEILIQTDADEVWIAKIHFRQTQKSEIGLKLVWNQMNNRQPFSSSCKRKKVLVIQQFTKGSWFAIGRTGSYPEQKINCIVCKMLCIGDRKQTKQRRRFFCNGIVTPSK